MQTGTQAAREAGNMVDLDSDPTKLIEIVEIGKQLLITRGALTTFSIANDISKYFAILPAIFVATYPQLGALNIMHLRTPESAILSAVIFNALIIVALVPLALRGVKFRPIGAAALLKRNLLIYGLGGIIAPFAGIKLIDMVLGVLQHLFVTEQFHAYPPRTPPGLLAGRALHPLHRVSAARGLHRRRCRWPCPSRPMAR